MTQTNKFNEISHSIQEIDKRTMKLESLFKKIEDEVISHNNKLDSINEKSRYSMFLLNNRMNNLRSEFNLIDKRIIKCINIIKHLAHNRDLKILEEKLSLMKIDQQVTHKDIKNMVIDRLNIEKSSFNE